MPIAWTLCLLLAGIVGCQTQARNEVARPTARNPSPRTEYPTETDPTDEEDEVDFPRGTDQPMYDHDAPAVPSQGPQSAIKPPPADSTEERIEEEFDDDQLPPPRIED